MANMRRLRNRGLVQSQLHSQPGRMKVLLGPVALDYVTLAAAGF
jgi:hypothetical protein